MNDLTPGAVALVRERLDDYHGDREKVARWISDTVHMPIRAARTIVAQVVGTDTTEEKDTCRS